MAQVFISYRRERYLLAENMCYALKQEGFSVFLDQISLASGDYKKKLVDEIYNCTDFLLIVSEHDMDDCVNEDDWIRWEISQALGYNKNIIPIFVDGFQFSFSLPLSIDSIRFLNGISLSTMDKLSIEIAIRTLIRRFLNSDRKEYYLTPNIFFIYDETPYLFCEIDNKKIKLSYEERKLLIYLIKNQDSIISIEHLKKILTRDDYLYREKIDHEKNILETLVRKIDVIERREREKNIEIIDDTYIIFRNQHCGRITPNNLFQTIKSCVNSPDFFKDAQSFYAYVLPALFFQALSLDLSKEYPNLQMAYNRDYLTDSEVKYYLREIFCCHNDSWHHIALKCKEIVEYYEIDISIIVSNLLQLYGDLPMDGLNINGIKQYEKLSIEYRKNILENEKYLQLAWWIGYSFVLDAMRAGWNLNDMRTSLEIAGKDADYGARHFKLHFTGKSLLYTDDYLCMELCKKYNLIDSNREINDIINSGCVSNYIEPIIKKIRQDGQAINLGMKETVVSQDEVLLMQGEYVIEDVVVRGKKITDFQKDYFEILDIEKIGGTISFYAKNTSRPIKFSIGADRMRIRMRHLIDLITNTNRTFNFLVIGIVSCVTNNNHLIIKPCLIEFIKTIEEKQKIKAFFDDLE